MCNLRDQALVSSSRELQSDYPSRELLPVGGFEGSIAIDEPGRNSDEKEEHRKGTPVGGGRGLPHHGSRFLPALPAIASPSA